MRTNRVFTHPGCGMCDLTTTKAYYLTGTRPDGRPNWIADRLFEATALQSGGVWFNHHNRANRRIAALYELRRVDRAELRAARRKMRSYAR